jgi:hypothetical protein
MKKRLLKDEKSDPSRMKKKVPGSVPPGPR